MALGEKEPAPEGGHGAMHSDAWSSDEVVLHEGLLQKNRPQGLRLIWQERGVRLTPQRLSWYARYRAPGRGWCHQFRGEIRLDDIAAAPRRHSDDRFSIAIRPGLKSEVDTVGGHPVHEPLILRHRDAATVDEWLSKLSATQIGEAFIQPPQGEAVFRGNPQPVYTLARDYAPWGLCTAIQCQSMPARKGEVVEILLRSSDTAPTNDDWVLARSSSGRREGYIPRHIIKQGARPAPGTPSQEPQVELQVSHGR
jgi:hypothetical protein